MQNLFCANPSAFVIIYSQTGPNTSFSNRGLVSFVSAAFGSSMMKRDGCSVLNIHHFYNL